MLQTHSQAQLVALQFAKAEMLADMSVLKDLVDDRCVLVGYMGVINGRSAVLNALSDGKRHQFNKRHFSKFVQVQHCLDSDLTLFSDLQTSSSPLNDDFDQGGMSFLGATPFDWQSEAVVRSPFDANGFDSHGFAQFERDGELSVDVRGSIRKVDVKETIVVNSRGLIILISRARRP